MIEWSDRQGHRDRRAWCLLVSRGTIVAFTGTSIPGVVAVVGSDYRQEGKWSHTTFRLELAPGVRMVAGHDGWETGGLLEALQPLAREHGLARVDRWADLATVLGVSVAECRRFLTTWRASESARGGGFGPRTVAALDEVEAALASLDDVCEDGADEVSVSFGSPVNRLRAAGFWAWPVVVRDGEGHEVGRVTPTEGETTGWDRPVVTGPVRVLESTHSVGYHGGHRSLRLAMPAGCVARHERPEEPAAPVDASPAPDAPAPAPSVGAGAFAAAFARAKR